MPCALFQFARQVEAAKRHAEDEQHDYDELMKWLDQADELLKNADQPVRDRNKEYKVSPVQCHVSFTTQHHFKTLMK